MATDPIKDGIVNMFDAAHGVADHLLKPIKPVDSVVHGVAIGIKNWLCDEHPGKKCDCGPSKDEKKKPDDHKGCDEPHGKGYGGDHFDNRDSNKNNKNTATGRVTTKVDVYAFGVVLMEIVTGRKALDETVPDERSHLVPWFRKVLINKESIRKAIDQTLKPDDETFDSICKVAELARYCTARKPDDRPGMGHAVTVLGPLVEQWKPSSHEEEESLGIDLDMSLLQTLQSLDSLAK